MVFASLGWGQVLLKHIDIDVCLASVGHPQDFWNHVKDEDFVQSLDLSQPSKTIPLAFHVDGVKVYKNQKVWVYSYSSMVRKRGNSLENKTVLAIVRDSMLAKPHAHDAMARVIAFICKTLSTGLYPLCDWKGNPWPSNSREHALAGTPLHVMMDGAVHLRLSRGTWKLESWFTRWFETTWQIWFVNIARLENCWAMLTSGRNAPWTSVRFSHQEFLDLNPPNRQSAWTNIPGWTKDRNLEDWNSEYAKGSVF